MRLLSFAFGVAGLAIATIGSGVVAHSAALRHPWATLFCLAAAGLLAAWGALAPWRRWLSRLVFESPRGLFNAALGLVAAALSARLAWALFEGVPRLDDSVAALFSARVFLTGRLTLPLPELPEFFKLFGVLSAANGVDRLAGMYPPGWPLLLVPGVLVGAPWLVNPLLGGGLAVAVVELGSELYERAVGRLAGILVALSPLLGVLAATHLSHTAAALFVCLGWWATLRLARTGRLRDGLLAGGAFGLALLCRPADALVVGAVVALAPLSRPRWLVTHWRSVLAAATLVALAVGGLLFYQAATTGDPLTPGHRVEMGGNRGLGFVHYARGQDHTPQRAVEHTRARLGVLGAHLLGWPIPAAAVVLVPFLLGRGGGREVWLLAPCLALLGLFALFWYYPGHFPGRYLASGLPPLFVLAAAGWREAARLAAPRRGWRHLPGLVLAFGLLFGLAVGRPAYFASFPAHHGDVETVLPRVVASYGLENALVLMTARGTRRGVWDGRNDYYASGFRLNDLDLAGDVVFARSLGADEDARLLAAYPRRSHYFYVFDRLRGRSWLYRLERRGDELLYEPVAPQDDLLLYDGKRYAERVR